MNNLTCTQAHSIAACAFRRSSAIRFVAALLFFVTLPFANVFTQETEEPSLASTPGTDTELLAANANLPEGYPLNRYSTLWERSPFVLEVVIDTPAPTASAFDGLSVVGVFSSGDLQMVTLYHQEKNQRYVVTNKPNPGDEYILENLQAGDSLDTTSITLRNAGGTETGTLRGSTSAVTAMRSQQPRPEATPPQPSGGAPNANRPPQPPQPNVQNSENNDDNRRRRRVIRPRTITP